VNGPRIDRRLWLPDLVGLLILTLLATLPFLTPHVDLALQRLFFTPDAPGPWRPGDAPLWWSHGNDPLWRWLYRFGPWPALLTAVGAFAVVIAAHWRASLARWRVHALFLLLTLALGPGLLVNVAFKDHWGRPRPRQTTELGGAWPYQTFVEKGLSGRGKSFPCGHSSTGYYFVAVYFLYRRRHPGRAIAAVAAAGVYGTLVGVARMAAGGHFASDVAWSAVMTIGAAYVVYYVVLRVPEAEDRLAAGLMPRPLPRWLLLTLPPLAVFAIAMGVLATPSYKEFKQSAPAVSPVRITLDITRCDVQLVFSDEPGTVIRVTGEAQGFGWPGSLVVCETTAGLDRGRPVATVRVQPKGWFRELNGRAVLTIPAGAAASVGGNIRQGDLAIQAADPARLPELDLLIEKGRVTSTEPLPAGVQQTPAATGLRLRTDPAPPPPASR
jgi:membrane-associated PAP2 superfamily phosphatase